MGRFSIAEDLERAPFITKKNSDNGENSGLGFDAKWDNSLASIFRQIMQDKDSESVNKIVKEIEHRCNASSDSFVSYTETHDIANPQEGGNARSASVVEDFIVNRDLIERAKVLPIALTLLSCGTPMIFQGQEIGETKPFFYPEPTKYDWDGLGIVWEKDRATKDSNMCHTREKPSAKLQMLQNVRNLIETMSMKSPLSDLKISQNSVPAASFQFYRTDMEGRVLVGIMNFHESASEVDSFEVPLPGSWTVVFSMGYEEEARKKVYSTATVDGKHFLQSMQIMGMAIILLRPTSDDNKYEDSKVAKTEPNSCRLNALKSVDQKNRKFFDETYWKNHVLSDLYPFWNSTDALGGENYGNFPTFRCNDGSAHDKVENPCPEIESSPGWIANYTDFDIAVQHSRQIFFYSVAFHMTGSSEMLHHARAGIDIFFEKYAILQTGAICTYKSKVNGACLPLEIDRTSMEHANALIGLSMYYYVTRDDDVANFIYKSVDYAFDKWYRSDLNMMGMAKRTSIWPPPSVPVLGKLFHHHQ